MSDKKTWVRFKKSGVLIGYGHHEGDVAEIDAEKAEEGMENGVLVRAKPAEIEVAKAHLAAKAEKAAAVVTPMSQSAMMKVIEDMQAQINALTSKK